MPPVHRHRASTSLRQSNKKHKSNSASKRSIHRNAGGKVSGNHVSGVAANSTDATHAKAARALMSKQKREQSKTKLLERRRLQGRGGHLKSQDKSSAYSWWSQPPASIVPRVVGIISLSQQEDALENSVRSFLMQEADSCNQDGVEFASQSNDAASSFTVQFKKMKKDGHVTFLTNSSAFRPHYYQSSNEGNPEKSDKLLKEDASVLAALDLCRISDLVLFLIHHDLRETNTYSHNRKVHLDDPMSFDGDDDDDELANDNHHAQMGEQMVIDNINETRYDEREHKKHSQDFDHLISSRGDRVLAAIKAQGLPTPLTVLVHEGDDMLLHANDMEESMSIFSMQSTKNLKRSASKLKQDVKKYMNRFAITEFGDNANKLMTLDMHTIIGADVKKVMKHPSASYSRDSLIRAICTMRCSTPKWVMDMPRSYILSHGSSLKQSESLGDCSAMGGFHYDPVSRELKLTGYIRGNAPWNVNSIIHIPNVGTFGVKCVECKNDYLTSLSTRTNHKKRIDLSELPGENKSLDIVTNPKRLYTIGNPLKRESLNMFACADALEGEQNLVGFDDDRYAERNKEQFKPGATRPVGWSDYQASWLDALDSSNNLPDHDEDNVDQGELAFDLNRKGNPPAYDDDMDIQDCDIALRENERNILLQQRKSDHNEDLKFPDEVELQRNEKARDRFARYRSIKSFRKTFWDPKENLPDSYSTIYHFSSFKATENDVMSDMKTLIKTCTEASTKASDVDSDKMECEDGRVNEFLEDMIPTGSFVTITVENLSHVQYSRISGHGLLVAVSLLPHENKMSVIQMGLSQSTQCDVESTATVPIKSKDNLIFRCGWRTWQGRPVFSQNNLNSDKHKFERFMPVNGAFFASSVFGPVTYSPSPVLVFRRNEPSGKIDFVAHGTILGADADRIVVKRIILTGYPTRVHKRHAVVKYMFYDPLDVKWFKPAGLTSKHGLEGNIVESVGEHGTMKCLFNAPIKQHDVVCLPLYKRIFPKYAPSEVLNDEGMMIKKDILVL